MRPFLKWAGNKFQVLPHILKILPKGKRLIEPFLGSSAVFVNTDFPEYLLADNNEDLINLFKTLQAEGKEFADYCQSLFTPKNNNKKRYYNFRDEFNDSDDVARKSALFIYMNRHCYNGLCRYNASGGFNVPFGLYDRPYFPMKELMNFHEKSKNAKFLHADFMDVLKKAKKGDVVYCDPPYVPLSSTASFTNNSADGFTMEQQEKLAGRAEALAGKGIEVIISNHNTREVKELYNKAKIVNIKVSRTMSCKANNRKKVSEVLAVF